MAESSVVVATRVLLAERLANWPGVGNVSWALVFFSAVPGAGELAACREAAKLCDKVVGVRLSDDKRVAPKLAETCRGAGCDLLWVPRAVEGHVTVDCGVAGLNGTLMTQAVMTVLPTLVVAHRTDLPLIRALRNISGGLGEVFSLRIVG